ncbi:MAG: ComF family protein [Burkholderiales bacterium]|nr:ComF family protein [Burkholderiales bacterium]
MFRQLIEGFSQRVPSQCAVCHAWPAQPVCEACVQAFAQPRPRCSTCSLPVPAGMRHCGNCVLHPPPVDQCLAAVDYAYPWSGLVVDFKFHQQPGWARSLGALMRSAPWVEPALEQADLLVPMPLSRQRLHERGFNQTLQLARALEPDKTAPGLLLRIHDTPPQSSLPRKERVRSVQGVYAVDPLKVAVIKDKRLVLLDDVMTSGASLFTAARVLREAGAAHITGLVFARTE